MRATDQLRRAVRPDREAAKLGELRQFDEAPGIRMVRDTAAAFAAAPPRRALDLLWIDPRIWFA